MAIVLQIRRLQSRVFSSSNNRHLNNTHSKKGVGFTDALFVVVMKSTYCEGTPCVPGQIGETVLKKRLIHTNQPFSGYMVLPSEPKVLIHLWRSMQKERRFYRRSFCVFCAVNVKAFFVNQLAEFYSYFSFPASDGFPSVL